MKQVIQNYRTGKLELAEVPSPFCSSKQLLVKNIASLISIGTERSILDLGRKSLLGKAKARPDLVKRFIDKAKTEGFVKTYKEALGRLDNPTPLGYSSAGIVANVGKDVYEFSPGDRVACIGAGYASHAEYVVVPEMLCAKIPLREKQDTRGQMLDGRYQMTDEDENPTSNICYPDSDYVTFEEASFGMLGIIALHGIRCADLSFGSHVAVIGLGLLGLLSVQMLKAYGCKVFGFDIDHQKSELAAKLGADYAFASEVELKDTVERATSGHGVDAVIITAATKSAGPVNMAVEMSRFRGKIVLVGVADVHPQRNELWHKEVEIIVSRAGGPGTFDPFYENKGIDYPIGYVRWTENRNLQEFMRFLSEKKIDVKPLISHRFKIEQAETVYRDMLANKGGPYIRVILNYGDQMSDSGHRKIVLRPSSTIRHLPSDTASVGVIGAGLFGKALLLPALNEMQGTTLKMLATSSSANAYHTGEKYGFEECTTDYHEVLNNSEINAIIILTPHSLHAKMVCEALEAGKHVFVEKPLCLTIQELESISELLAQSSKLKAQSILMVGYNRRFSPHAREISEYFAKRQDPMVINYRVNAGFVPSDHWVHAKEQGGGRIIGEICHFVDMMQCLTGCNPVRVFAERISGNNKTAVNNDNLVINLKFEDGSVGNIVYSASGDKAFSRERIEVFCEGKTVVSTDFRKTTFHFGGKKRTYKTSSQAMGYKEELMHFFDVVTGKAKPELTSYEIFYSTLAVFKIHESLQKGQVVEIYGG